jgi:hypothetical protein
LANQADGTPAHYDRDVWSCAGIPRIGNRIIDPGCIGFEKEAVDAARNVN